MVQHIKKLLHTLDAGAGREFDFLPESMRFYPHNLSKEAAKEASSEIKQMLGLKPY